MHTFLRSACAAVLTLLLAATASPAVAKGPTAVGIVGPDLTTRLSYRTVGGDVDLGTLTEAAQLFQHWDGSGHAPRPRLTGDALGPRYVLTWTAGGAGWAVQHAYPFAEGGAWVRFVSMPSGGRGGWLRTPTLTEQLVALGAGEETLADSASDAAPVPAVATTDESTAPGPGAAGTDHGTSYAVVVPVGLAVLVVLGAGVLLARRRLVSR